MDLKGSKTEQNLMKAFAGETQAKCKYEYYANVAKKEGFKEIYYCDIKDMRDNLESKDRIYYLGLYEYFNDVVDQEKNRINAPTMIAVKDGKLSGFHIDTVSSHIINEQGILPPLSEEQKNELHKVIKDLLDKVK